MFGLPTHEIFAVKENGEMESIMITDCNSRENVIEEIRWYIKDMIKHNNTRYEEWDHFDYVNHMTCFYRIMADEIFKEA